MIEVRVFATLRQGRDKVTMLSPEGITCAGDILAQLNDPDAELCAKTERLLSRELGGDCSSPIGCFAETEGGEMLLRGFYGEGEAPRSGSIRGSKTEAVRLAKMLAEQLKKGSAVI